MKKLLISLMAIALVIGMAGMGAFAYFSDTETSSGNTFTAGTLDLVLTDNNETDQNGVTATWVSPANWAPGDPEVLAVLTMKNIGTDGAVVARIKGLALVELNNTTTNAEGKAGGDVINNIADQIYITTINYTEAGSWIGTPPVNLVGYYATIFGSAAPGSNTLPLTLREFVDTSYSMVFWTGAGNPGASGQDYLPAGGTTTESLRLGFTFQSGAGNAYQSDTATFNVRVIADDDPAILGKGGDCYGYVEAAQ